MGITTYANNDSVQFSSVKAVLYRYKSNLKQLCKNKCIFSTFIESIKLYSQKASSAWKRQLYRNEKNMICFDLFIINRVENKRNTWSFNILFINIT